jgi:hypothetical protein
MAEESALGSLDVAKAYESLQTLWTQIRADVLSHLVVAFLVFRILGVTVPPMPWSHIDPEGVMGNPYFKLAKESGLLLLVPLFALLVIAVYVSVLHAVGTALFSLVLVLGPIRGIRWVLSPMISTKDLTALAATLDHENFTLEEIEQAFPHLVSKYQITRKDEFASYNQAFQKVSRNSARYLTNCLFFLCVWLLIFLLSPGDNAWIEQNRHLFSRVAGLLAVLSAFALWRTLSSIETTMAGIAIAAAWCVQTDPEFSANLADSKRTAIANRITQLRDDVWKPGGQAEREIPESVPLREIAEHVDRSSNRNVRLYFKARTRAIWAITVYLFRGRP